MFGTVIQFTTAEKWRNQYLMVPYNFVKTQYRPTLCLEKKQDVWSYTYDFGKKSTDFQELSLADSEGNCLRVFYLISTAFLQFLVKF